MTLSRIIRGAEGRRTRFHSYRGDFLGRAIFRDLPGSAWRRLRPTNDPKPWMNARAIALLEASVSRDTRVVEFGGGNSTLWLASRCGSVMCYEDDPSWVTELTERLRRLQSSARVDIRLTADFPASASSLAPSSYDVVIVDHNEHDAGDRVRTLISAREAVRPDGLLVLDDSDRGEYAAADELMADWVRTRTLGLRPSPLQAAETTFYRRAR